jgi:hypothetical protein
LQGIMRHAHPFLRQNFATKTPQAPSFFQDMAIDRASSRCVAPPPPTP